LLAPPGNRNNPRRPKRVFRHGEAFNCILRDYLGQEALFSGKNFEMMFRLSRSRVQRLLEDIGNAQIPFFINTVDAAGNQGASIEARVLLPLKTYAYGVPPHTFTDYFQMSVDLAKECCRNFDRAVKDLYADEYLRLPTAQDIKNVTRLHEAKHGIPGMFGSLDCMHTPWKNCPKAWQASYVSGQDSKKKSPSLVLEAVADYNMWFWHASFGYAGSLNDLNILNLSPFLESLVDGTFHNLETQSRRVPYAIDGEIFHLLHVMVDGIYPMYSRFVRTIHEPVTAVETMFAKWHEDARKDVERAFGNLQSKFQVTCRPILQHDLNRIADTITACLIMHNISVSDRVMEGDVHATYNPSNILDIPDLEEEEIGYPDDFDAIIQGGRRAFGAIGLRNGDQNVIQNMLTRQDHWRALNDILEHARLNDAIMFHVYNR
jgi:Plant transposon protein.